jgi:hypothetical protein
MTTAFMFIVAINALATIALWRVAARRPARPSKKFIRALFGSEPLVPSHGIPKRWTYDDDDINASKRERSRFGEMIRSQQLFFYDFSDFGMIVNSWFERSEQDWRLQELADNRRRLFSQEFPPDFGRRYSIFYNQTDLGVLEMQHGLDGQGHDYSKECPIVWTAIQLHWVRLFELSIIQGLLNGIAMHVSDYQREGAERTEVRAAIEQAIRQVLWTAQHISEFPELSETDRGELECRINGSPLLYLQRREQLRRERA